MTKIHPTQAETFSLIELAVSISIFLIIIAIVMNFYGTARNVWTISENKRQTFEDGRIALELISRDLHTIYYTPNTAPFWFKNKTTTGEWYDAQSINFISLIDMADDMGSSSGMYEVKYFLWYPENGISSDSDGWLMRSVTGDASPKWNFAEYPLSVGLSGTNNALTANNDSNEPAHKLIPFVTRMEFNCFNRTGTAIAPNDNKPQELPYSVELRISILSKSEWQKWISIGGSPAKAIDGTEAMSNLSAAIFREKNEIIFSKTILLSERGQN